MINVRGLNVYPREVEEILYLHPAVAEACVVGVRNEYKGEIPKAYLVLKDGHRANAKELIHHCAAYLASYKVPRIIESRDTLPKTSTGKIQKRVLREEN